MLQKLQYSSFLLVKLGLLTWLILASWFWDHPEQTLWSFVLLNVSILSFVYLWIKDKPLYFFLFIFSCSIFFWSKQEPSLDRNWVDYQAKLPKVTIQSNNVKIQNLRHDLRYLPGGELKWLTRSYDLNALSEVRFALVTFTEWRGLAHLFLSFNFSDRDFLSVSGEIRREKDESYSPIKGLFRKYEKMIVLGTEEDLIGLRIFSHKDPVTFYPLIMSKENAQALLISLLDDCQKLEKQPRYYNTLTQNCATLIEKHLELVYKQNHQLDLRLIFPGFADLIGIDYGLIDLEESVESIRDKYLLKVKQHPSGSGNSWSMKLRVN